MGTLWKERPVMPVGFCFQREVSSCVIDQITCPLIYVQGRVTQGQSAPS